MKRTFSLLSIFLFTSVLVAFQPQTKAELQTAVDLWVSDNATALATYGEITIWDVSGITNMDNLFNSKTTFNDDISNWDVSNVTSMKAMFNETSKFNNLVMQSTLCCHKFCELVMILSAFSGSCSIIDSYSSKTNP